MKLPRFITKLIPEFEVVDVKEWHKTNCVEIYIQKQKSSTKPHCSKCGNELGVSHGRYPLRLKTMPIFNFETYLCLWREKRFCTFCKKVRSEKLEFIAEETPHLTREYVWWLGRMCEFSPVSKAAEFTDNCPMTLWRIDFERMRRMLQQYKIPAFKRISVDEVYARKKSYYAKESRDKRFFTVICDLDSRRVLWVSDSRSKEALDEFFKIIGPERCKEIEAVAADQHDPYKASVNEYCPQAVFVWDRFHIMQNFEVAVNEDRAWLHTHVCRGEMKRLTRGKFKTLFLKKSDRRTSEEKRHIKDVLKENEDFVYLELIKEGMFEVYQSKDEYEAREKFVQMGEWIREIKTFYSLNKWWENLNRGWDTFKNYFQYRITSSLSEGINNVIKTIKKRAYGYRNMAYFKLKIMQVCGYLNSKYISMDF
ncbi:MAG: ISL3 family transposase [Bacteriovoracaceae bacterium]